MQKKLTTLVVPDRKYFHREAASQQEAGSLERVEERESTYTTSRSTLVEVLWLGYTQLRIWSGERAPKP